MTSKERLTNMLNKKPIDRVPVWMLFPYEKTPYATDVHNTDSYKAVNELVYKQTDFLERRYFPSRFCLNGNTEIMSQCQDGKWTVSYRDIAFQSGVYNESGMLKKEPFVKTIEDLDKILSIPYTPDFSGIDIERERTFEKTLGHNGLVTVMLVDPISILHDLCDETEFCILCYTEEEKVTAFLDEMQKRCIDRCKYFLDNNIGDVFWFAGSEFVVPPMISPEYFAKYVTPHSKQIVDLIRSYGKKSIIHCHGKIAQVLDQFKIIGMDMLHPIEAPPMGDCPLSLAREVLGDDVVLVGNIQFGDLVDKSAGEVAQTVKEACLEGKKGNFILAMTASPTFKEIDSKIQENYITIIKTALKYAVK